MPAREDDITLYKQWKKHPTNENASLLVNQLLPLVKQDVYRYSSNIPYAIVEARAKILILQAAQNYDPKYNVALGTFVKSYMVKLNQFSDEWRSPIKIPAHRAAKYDTFKTSFEQLSNVLNREPNVSELADHLKWSQAEVTRFTKEIRKEFTDDRPFMSNYEPRKSVEEDMIEFVYHDLSPTEKILFEFTTGYGGKPIIKNPEIMVKLKWDQNKLSYEKKKLADKIELMLKGHV